MLGAVLASAALNTIGSVAGGLAASKAMGKVEDNIKQQMDENEDLHDRLKNEDPTKRTSAQQVLTMTEDAIRKRNRAAAGTQAVMGGTQESVAAAKAANNEVLTDAAARIAAAGEARKDQIESQYLNRKEALQGQLNQLQTGKAQNIAAATQGVANAAGSIGAALSGTPASGAYLSKDFTDEIARQNQAATLAWLDKHFG